MRVVGIKIVIQELTRKTYQYLTALKINLLNGNLNEVAICKHCKNVLVLTEKATQRTINIIFKSNYCRYCETLMEKSKSGKIGKLEYLSFCTRHKVDCSHDHDGSPRYTFEYYFCYF